MTKTTRIAIILIAFMMLVLGTVMLNTDGKKAESIYYGASMVSRQTNRQIKFLFGESDYDKRGINDSETCNKAIGISEEKA